MATVDIKRAYFFAPASRRMYNKPPEEDQLPGEEGMLGELKLSLYGTRDAAMNWTKRYTEHLIGIGFKCGLASACNLTHEKRNIKMTCQVDDFVIIATEDDICWLIEEMKKVYELKATILGPESHHKQEVRILNRIVRWSPEGIQYECDQRHADVIVKELGMEDQKPLSSPGAADIMAEIAVEEEKEDREALRKEAQKEGSDTVQSLVSQNLLHGARQAGLDLR